MKVNQFIFLLSILIILSGCKDDVPNGPEKPDAPFSDGLMPLKVGNQWTYREYVLDGETGEIKYELPGSFHLDLISEYLKGKYKGEEYEGLCWDTQYVGSGQESIVKWVYINKPDGLYQVGGLAKTDTSINNILHYKYPVKKGESWLVPRLFYEPNWYLQFFIDDSIRYECTDTAAVFHTPLGDIKCYVYRHLIDLGEDVLEDWEYFEYFKPGLGLVGAFVYGYYPRTKQRSYKFKMILQSTNLSN